jgi:hypothetical protein
VPLALVLLVGFALRFVLLVLLRPYWSGGPKEQEQSSRSDDSSWLHFVYAPFQCYWSDAFFTSVPLQPPCRSMAAQSTR